MVVINGVEVLPVREAARLVRRTPETVRRWVWSGRLTAVKDGNRLMVPRAQLLALTPARTSAGSDAEPLTLAQWAEKAAASSRGRPGGSAVDLVLEDRSSRRDGEVRAGR